jgi:hypothetical protein
MGGRQNPIGWVPARTGAQSNGITPKIASYPNCSHRQPQHKRQSKEDVERKAFQRWEYTVPRIFTRNRNHAPLKWARRLGCFGDDAAIDTFARSA